ncbi:27369_t:CDS:2, partial [Gigaspora margarita]
SENLTDKEELDIKNKFIDADTIIKKTLLKSLPEEITSLKVSTQLSPTTAEQIAKLNL